MKKQEKNNKSCSSSSITVLWQLYLTHVVVCIVLSSASYQQPVFPTFTKKPFLPFKSLISAVKQQKQLGTLPTTSSNTFTQYYTQLLFCFSHPLSFKKAPNCEKIAGNQGKWVESMPPSFHLFRELYHGKKDKRKVVRCMGGELLVVV